MAKYRVLVGLDYPPAKRAEAGDIVSDLPAKSISWLRDAGLIEPLDDAPAKSSGKSKNAAPADESEED